MLFFVIKGKPTVAGVFDYVVRANSSCDSISRLIGRIVVNSDTVLSVSDNQYQILCLNSTMNPIQFEIKESGIMGASLSPLTLSESYNSGIYTVSGVSPSTSGVHTYYSNIKWYLQ